MEKDFYGILIKKEDDILLTNGSSKCHFNGIDPLVRFCKNVIGFDLVIVESHLSDENKSTDKKQIEYLLKLYEEFGLECVEVRILSKFIFGVCLGGNLFVPKYESEDAFIKRVKEINDERKKFDYE